MLGAAALGATAAGLAAMEVRPAFAQQNAISPDEALKRIMDGNARYAANATEEKDFSAARAQKALGQWPVAGIVSCADSRVAPELLFDQAPGDLFVVRVAGNIVNTDGIASLEYGVAVLNIPLIMVLGHSRCGAVDAAIKTVQDKQVLPGHLPQLTNAIRPAVVAAQASNAGDLLAAATKANVQYGMQNLRLGSSIIADAIAAGKVAVVGGNYDLATGKVIPVEAA